jgi:hypothetical protein
MPRSPSPIPFSRVVRTDALCSGVDSNSTVHTTTAIESNDSKTSTVPMYDETGKGDLTRSSIQAAVAGTLIFLAAGAFVSIGASPKSRVHRCAPDGAW